MDDNRLTPLHWKQIKLGDLGNIILGQSPPSNTYNTVGLGLPFFQGKAEFCDVHPIATKWCSAPQKIAEPNDILISVRAPVGATNIANLRCCIGRGLAAIRTKNFKFIYYFLKSKQTKIEELGTGTTFKAISGDNLKNILVPVFSNKEQEQIVEKIEELFSELDAGRRQLETVKEQLKTYRQAVLKYAFEGRLTNKIVKNGEIPNGWIWETLEKVCKKIQDGSHFSPKCQYDAPGLDRFKYITAKNIRNNYLDLSNITYVDRQFHSSIFNRCNPQYGDVLMTKDGVNTGDVTINTIQEDFSLLSSVCLFKPKKELLDSSYLKFFFQSSFGLKIIETSMTGTAIKRIILKKLRAAKIILPSLAEQERIVSEVDSRLSVCDNLWETIDNCIQQTESLKQTILKQAF